MDWVGSREEDSKITGFWLGKLSRWVVLFAEMGKRESKGSRITVTLFQLGLL